MSFVIAEVVVSPRKGEVVAHVVNPQAKTDTLYAGTMIVRSEKLNSICVAAVSTETADGTATETYVLEASAEKHQLLWKIALDSGADLTEMKDATSSDSCWYSQASLEVWWQFLDAQPS